MRFVKPFFSSTKGEVFAWLANTGHWPDVGGMVPAASRRAPTEVEQEGLRLPPVSSGRRADGPGDPVDHSCPTSASPTAHRRHQARRAALTTGDQRLTALIDPLRAETVRQAIAEMRHRAERQMRAKIAGIPTASTKALRRRQRRRGRRAADDQDEDHQEGRRSAVRHDGSSPPCRGPMNSVIATTNRQSIWREAHLPDVPINAGTFEAAQDHRAEGTFLYAAILAGVGLCRRG